MIIIYKLYNMEQGTKKSAKRPDVEQRYEDNKSKLFISKIDYKKNEIKYL